MSFYILFGMLLPFFGTTIGSAGVFFTQKTSLKTQNSALSGFAAGVMMAASVWSLIIPAVEMSASFGFFSFLPMIYFHTLELNLNILLIILFSLIFLKLFYKNSRKLQVQKKHQ